MSKKNPIQLSDHFTYSRLFRFVLPSIVMMVFTSIYGVVDGLFVSNFAGKTAFASINLIMPFLIILGAMGFMLAQAARRWSPACWARATRRARTSISP